MSRTRVYVVGSDPRCDIWLNDESVSRRHAEVLRLVDGRLYVTDCQSTNGTYLLHESGEQRLRQEFVPNGTRIRFGTHVMDASELQRACRHFRWWQNWSSRVRHQPREGERQ
ncbi:MAG: FHA domain-containing protein [Gammaproteobacteria bacterium]|nr:FHA domain-containing protein [Gammaproteobacteria bacterium]